jgi:hypothetical protein
LSPGVSHRSVHRRTCDRSLHHLLNTLLGGLDLRGLDPYLLFLKRFYHALRKLPAYSGMLYCPVKVLGSG